HAARPLADQILTGGTDRQQPREHERDAMRSSYIPSTNNGLVSFSKNLVTRLTAQEGHFGVPSQRLASLSALQADFADAQAQVTLMTNRPATARRNAARAALLDEIRGVVAIVRAQQDVTDAQKITLGLTIPGKRRRAIPRPRVAPRMIIHAIDGHRVHVMLFDQESDHYRRPRDVAGAAIFLHVGEQPSRDPKQWKHVGDATRA